MAGQLPIDRARSAQRSPKELEQEKQKLAQKEAKLRRKAREYDDELERGEREPHVSEDEE